MKAKKIFHKMRTFLVGFASSLHFIMSIKPGIGGARFLTTKRSNNLKVLDKILSKF